jgi:hypothetical protein
VVAVELVGDGRLELAGEAGQAAVLQRLDRAGRLPTIAATSPRVTLAATRSSTSRCSVEDC